MLEETLMKRQKKIEKLSHYYERTVRELAEFKQSTKDTIEEQRDKLINQDKKIQRLQKTIANHNEKIVLQEEKAENDNQFYLDERNRF